MSPAMMLCLHFWTPRNTGMGLGLDVVRFQESSSPDILGTKPVNHQPLLTRDFVYISWTLFFYVTMNHTTKQNINKTKSYEFYSVQHYCKPLNLTYVKHYLVKITRISAS